MKLSYYIQRASFRLLSRTYWYNNVAFGDCAKFWKHRTFDMDVVNLGSSSGKAAFDYSAYPLLKAANWAMAPQTFVADLEILRNYSCFLKEGATVILPICPFSSLGGANDDFPDKYYTVLNIASIPNASFRRYKAQMQIKEKPWLYFPALPIEFLHNKLKRFRKPNVEIDAQIRLSSWKKEFSILDFENELSIVNKDSYDDGISILKQIFDYCKSHHFNVVAVLPPVHEALSNEFTLGMKQKFIDAFIGEAIKGEDVAFLDYFTDKRFTGDMFNDSYLLNKKGARIFTDIVLKDIKLI